MANIYVEYTFLLESGKTRVVTVKDLKDTVTDSELTALSDMFLEKNTGHEGSAFTSLKKCEKYTVDVEVIG